MEELNKNNPFKTPKKYFEEFDARLKEKLSEAESGIPSKEGFAVPEDYFETVQVKILDQLNAKETKVIPLNSYKKYYYAAASIAALAVMIVGLNWNSKKDLSFESVAEAEIENYFETNDYDLSAYEMAEVIPFSELEINDILSNGFNEDNLVDYLNENTEDLDELNLEEYE